jgi:hypothetical protein
MRYVETAQLTPSRLGTEGDLLLAASRPLEALALFGHCWPAPSAERGAWSTRPWRPAQCRLICALITFLEPSVTGAR